MKKTTKKVVKAEVVAPAVDADTLMLDEMVAKAKEAQEIYATFSQEQVDAVFRAAAMAGNSQRIPLAKMAYEDTGMGIIEDKVIKNHYATEYIYNKYRDLKTCGIIEKDEQFGTITIAEPVGVIAGVVPTTNPTATAIFKALLALKTRNAIIFSPHPRAKRSTGAAVALIAKAVVDAGAPEGLVQCIENPTVALSSQLMSHKNVSLVLATGGPGMVKAAYSSGTPAIGVGAGNTPAIIDSTADLKMAVNSIIISKTFDNGVICASEQSVIAEASVYEEVKKLFADRNCHILSKADTVKVGKTILPEGKLNANIVGKPAAEIAALAGVKTDPLTKILIGEVTDTSMNEPFAHEKLSPVLALYKAEDYEDALCKAEVLIKDGGMGHTCALYTNPANAQRIEDFGMRMKTCRILVNTPSSQGGIGDIYNFKLNPSLTLGCGSWGGNIVSENVTPEHLLNTKTVAIRRENMLWYRVPPKIFFKYGCLPEALKDLRMYKRAFIVTDKPLFDLGATKELEDGLKAMGMTVEIFHDVKPDPDLTTALAGVERIKTFAPDIIFGVGGGSAMDAAKLMRLMYEHPEVKFEDLAMRFMDIRKRIVDFPTPGTKTYFVCIPTTSGTGSEVTPFAVVTDDRTGAKYPLADYALTPDMAIVDPKFVTHMPKSLTAFSGIDAVTHAFEAIASTLATDFSDGQALTALKLLFQYLPDAYAKGAGDLKAREKVHYASCLAGMAFSNSFLGVCHSMAHKLGAAFHIPHGLANALLINETIRFNATPDPRKMGLFPQYEYPQCAERYANIADYLGLGGKTVEQKIEKLIEAVDKLKKSVGIPASIKDVVNRDGTQCVPEDKWLEGLEKLSENAFDDQCTGANPRYPLISEIKKMYNNAYYGVHTEV